MDNTFIQEKLSLQLTFKPGLALTGFRNNPALLFVAEWSNDQNPQPGDTRHSQIFPASRGLSRRGKMKRQERDLCRLPTSFLSRMHLRFPNNQWRFCHVQLNLENRFGLVHQRFASWLQFISIGDLRFCHYYSYQLFTQWDSSTTGSLEITRRPLVLPGGKLKIGRSLSGDMQTYRVL